MPLKVKEIKEVEWVDEEHFRAIVLTEDGNWITYTHSPENGWWRWAYADKPTVCIEAKEVPPEVVARYSRDVN